jgi:hypothetical protein
VKGFPFLSYPFNNLILSLSLELYVCAWEASITVSLLFAWNILEYNPFMVASHTHNCIGHTESPCVCVVSRHVEMYSWFQTFAVFLIKSQSDAGEIPKRTHTTYWDVLIIIRDSQKYRLLMGLVVDGTGRVYTHIKLSLCMLCSIKTYGAIEYISTLFIRNEMVENCHFHTLATFICTFQVQRGELDRP